MCTCLLSLCSPMRNPVDGENVPVCGGDFILFTGVAVVGDDFTLS